MLWQRFERGRGFGREGWNDDEEDEEQEADEEDQRLDHHSCPHRTHNVINIINNAHIM